MYSSRSASGTRPATGGMRTTSSLLATLSSNIPRRVDHHTLRQPDTTNRPNSARCAGSEGHRSVLPTKQPQTMTPRPAVAGREGPSPPHMSPKRPVDVRPPPRGAVAPNAVFRRASGVRPVGLSAPLTSLSDTLPIASRINPSSRLAQPAQPEPHVDQAAATAVRAGALPHTTPPISAVEAADLPPPVADAPKAVAVADEGSTMKAPPSPRSNSVMERRHTGCWVREFPKSGYFACNGCSTPVASAAAKVPSVRGYATFGTYFEHSVELGVVIPPLGGEGFVAVHCVKCRQFIGRLCTEEADELMGRDDAIQANSSSLKHVDADAPPGFVMGSVAADDRMGRRRRGKGARVESSSDDSDDSCNADGDIWENMRRRRQ